MRTTMLVTAAALLTLSAPAASAATADCGCGHHAVTTVVSVTNGGQRADAYGGVIAVSGDGRFVVFTSNDPELLTVSPSSTSVGLFVRDLRAHRTTRVDVTNSGVPVVGDNVFNASISADGRYVAFSSGATNLAPGVTTPGSQAAYVHDLRTGRTEAVGVSSGGVVANAAAWSWAISGNGRTW